MVILLSSCTFENIASLLVFLITNTVHLRDVPTGSGYCAAGWQDAVAIGKQLHIFHLAKLKIIARGGECPRRVCVQTALNSRHALYQVPREL